MNTLSATQRTLIIASVLIAVAVVTSSWFLFKAIRSIEIQQQEIDSATQAQQGIESLTRSVFQSVAAERGFILTKQPTFLSYYQVSRDEAIAQINLTRANMAQFPELIAIYESFVESTRKLHAELDSALLKVQSHQTSSAVETVRSMVPTTQLQEIRKIGAFLRQELTSSIQLRVDSKREAMFFAYGVLLVSLLGNLFLLTALMWLLYRTATRAKNTRETVEANNAKLNSLVKGMMARSEHVHQLSDAMRFLQACQTSEEAIYVLKQRLPLLFTTRYGALYLFNDCMSLERMCQWGDSEFKTEFVSDECWAMRRGQAILQSQDGTEIPCYHLAEGGRTLTTKNIAYKCIPMVAHGEIVGLLVLGSDKGLHQESADTSIEDEAMQSAAEHISLQLANLKLQEKLEQQSIKDALTHLYNRRYLGEFLQREFSIAKRNLMNGSAVTLFVMVIDVDHFKRFNDTYGHDTGDLVLVKVAETLQKSVRSSDLVARYGGEEFVVVLPNVEIELAKECAERIRKAVDDLSIHHNGKELGPITISIGLAGYPDDGDADLLPENSPELN